ncbi:hypothetical protein [Tamlana crocina]|uniref:Secreted protein n=1 Tax=Tamlana crocina TaxID=393006 RepID=A0ABX1DHS8_9FLAO|nr:hypothetical protein [Tamlana crocina]NJX15871.1 hypothetical protein [Tamlana crocina]
MKSLKITLVAVAIFASLVSCTKQDLTEDDVLERPDVEAPITGGQFDD